MKYVVLLSFIIISFCSHGQYYYKRHQNPDSLRKQNNYNLPPAREIVVKLSPITYRNFGYYYDDKRVSFDQLTMPLLAVKDQEILKQFKSLLILRIVRSFISLGPAVVVATIIKNPQNAVYYHNLYIGIFTGSFIAISVLNEVTISIKRKAIDRYNEIILQPTVSLQPNSGANFGLSLRF